MVRYGRPSASIRIKRARKTPPAASARLRHVLQFGPLVRDQCDRLSREWHITLESGSMLIVFQRKTIRMRILIRIEQQRDCWGFFLIYKC
jgi:hypothetical protein